MNLRKMGRNVRVRFCSIITMSRLYAKACKRNGGARNFILVGAFENLVGPKKIAIRFIFPINRLDKRMGLTLYLLEIVFPHNNWFSFLFIINIMYCYIIYTLKH
jgi:hypothetical protein